MSEMELLILWLSSAAAIIWPPLGYCSVPNAVICLILGKMDIIHSPISDWQTWRLNLIVNLKYYEKTFCLWERMR